MTESVDQECENGMLVRLVLDGNSSSAYGIP